MYPQGVCRIRKPAYAGNGCAIFPAFEAARIEEKIRCLADGDLFRVSLKNQIMLSSQQEGASRPIIFTMVGATLARPK